MDKTARPIFFFGLVFILSIPFWILDFFAPGLAKNLPIKLPISALMAVCPLLAAAILAFRENGFRGVRDLQKKAFDYRKIRHKKWWLTALFGMPLLVFLTYWLQRLADVAMPAVAISWAAIPALFLAFFIAAFAEELGWMGYAFEPLEKRFGTRKSAWLLGAFWAAWHLVPYFQLQQTLRWIFWQCLGTMFLRLLMVWVFKRGGSSVFLMVLFHAMINLSVFSFPNFGSHYDPMFGGIVFGLAALAIFLFSKPDTTTK